MTLGHHTLNINAYDYDFASTMFNHTLLSGVARGEQKGHLPPHFFGIVDKTF